MATGQERFSTMMAASPTILPSLLQCDFGNLEREVERLEEAGVAGLHLDVMDGVFCSEFHLRNHHRRCSKKAHRFAA